VRPFPRWRSRLIYERAIKSVASCELGLIRKGERGSLISLFVSRFLPFAATLRNYAASRPLPLSFCFHFASYFRAISHGCYLSGLHQSGMSFSARKRVVLEYRYVSSVARVQRVLCSSAEPNLFSKKSLNGAKSVQVTFTTRRKMCPPVILKIPQAEELCLDRRLNWRKHIFIKRKQLSKMY